MHNVEPERKAQDEDKQVDDAREEMSGDVVEHDADLATQPWIPAQKEDHFQKGKDYAECGYPLDHAFLVL